MEISKTVEDVLVDIGVAGGLLEVRFFLLKLLHLLYLFFHSGGLLYGKLDGVLQYTYWELLAWHTCDPEAESLVNFWHQRPPNDQFF